MPSAANRCILTFDEMLTHLDFAGECIIFVLGKRREPQTCGFSPSFLVKILIYKACFTSDIEKNTSEIDFFLGFIVEFFRQVVVIMSDVERQKVKSYLFSQGSDLTFQGSPQMDF